MNKLYEFDYLQWLDDQTLALQKRDWGHLDVEHLIEELEELGDNLRDRLEGWLRQLLAHLIKRHYLPAKYDQYRNHWLKEISTFKFQINNRLEKSRGGTAAKHLQECFNSQKFWLQARKEVRIEYGLSLADVPVECPWNLDQVLDESFPVFLED